MNPIYLDHAATTPMRAEVREAMAPFASARFGNPSSTHRWGRAASAALEAARSEIAEALGATPSEIRFVRGGTESDNMAVLGSCLAHVAAGGVPTLVVSAIEHSAVLECAEYAADAGLARLTVVDVTAEGALDLDAVMAAIGGGPATVSLMWVNNETGLVLPIREVAERLAGSGAVFHTDASQAIGKVRVNVEEGGVALLTATGHKMNGPKGSGLLYVRTGTPLNPLLHGGGQERALRPGTEDVAGAVGLAAAVRLAVSEMDAQSRRLAALRSDFEDRLMAALPDVRINCGDADRAPHVCSVGVGGIADGAALLMALDLEGVAVSGGSACHSGAGKGSHVIEALYGSEDPFATVRFSFGRGTTEEETHHAVRITTDVVGRLRALATA